IFEKEKEAQELVEKLDAKVKESKEVINNKRVLFLNVDDKGIKSYGASGRFGGFLNQDLGIQHADTKIKPNSSGILISNEYLEKMNPDKLFVINRTQDENDDSIPNALKNPVINNAKAIENNDVYVFEANTWFFGEGGINLTMQQLNQIQQAYQ
ncbi:ABC transporter substrate-binding protein, partial [Staphylococcus equorum]